MPLAETQLAPAFEREFPHRDWNQSCQAGVAHLAEFTTGTATFYLTAKEAFQASHLVSANPSRARLNDVHYWAIGPDWHVGVELGSGRVFMASKHSDSSFGLNLGVATIPAYNAATGALYRGFSRTNGVNRIQVTPPKPTTGGSSRVRLIAAYLNAESLGRKTTAAQDGIVDQTGTIEQTYWWLVQEWGRQNGIYPTPPWQHDGKVARVGGQTRKVEAEIYKRAKAVHA